MSPHLTFFNVNEEDQTYDEHDNLEAAVAILEEFPNDTIVVCLTDGIQTDALRRNHV